MTTASTITANQKQSVSYTILNMLGLSVSIFATIFIYPRNIEAYGIIQFLISTTVLILPFITLGTVATITKFFTEFDVKGKLPELFGFVLLTIVVCSFVFFALLYIFQKPLYNFLSSIDFNIGLLTSLDLYLGAIALLSGFSALFISYAAIFRKITVPSLINDIVVKFGVPIIVLLSIYLTFSDTEIGIAYLILCAVILLVNICYLLYLKKFKIRVPGKYLRSRIKEISSYSSYTLFGGVGYLLVYRLDIFIITMLLDAKMTGYYSILLFLAGIIEIPGKGLFKLLGPQISESFAKKNMEKVQDLYVKSSESLMLVAGAIAIVILSGIKPFFLLMENGEFLLASLNIWFLLVIAKWYDQLTGINASIINYSSIYRTNLYFVLVQGALNVVLNYYLITKYGLIGAALATFITVISLNTLKSIYIYRKLKVSPLSKKYVVILLYLITFTFIAIYLPYSNINLLDFTLRPLVIIILQLLIIYKLKISSEINSFIDSWLLRIKHLFRQVYD